jgi:hypothetical protein
MASFSVGITKREGAVDAWVFDLPGCRVIGNTREEAVGLVPVIIAEYQAWLRGHGETTADTDLSYEVVEEVESTSEFVFDADRASVTAEEMETGIRRIGYALADLQRLSGTLPGTVMDWRPPLSSVKIENYPDVRNMNEILSHAVGSMSNFLNNLGEGGQQGPRGETPAIDVAQSAAVARLQALSDADRGRVFSRANPRGGPDIEWSARKTIRRIINHERFHAKEIEQRLAWLILAVPEVIPASKE